MKNKLLALPMISLVLISILLSTIPITPTSASPGEWHVYPGQSIQAAIDAASPGDTIIIHSGTYTEGPQILINKNLTITGTEVSMTVVKPAGDTGSSGDARGWFLVNPDVVLNLSSLTLDGSGRNIYQAIRHKGQGTITNCIFQNIAYPSYQGFAIVLFGGNVDVFSCTFLNIGRVGVLYFGTVVTDSEFIGNSYTGKGDGDWLDYGVEVGAGAHVLISGNTISTCTGIASVDNSTSAGILVTTYYGAGSQAIIINNDISGCSYGIAVGYDEADTSSVVAHMNNLYDNDWGIDSTAPAVDARFNWWGDASGPYHNVTNPGGLGNNVSDYIDYSPWLGATFETTPRTYHVNPTGTIQEAISEASPGDTITVHAGTYDEQVVIDKSLILQGTGDTTTIQPSGTGQLTSFYTLPTQAGASWNGKKIASIISVENVGTAGVTISNLKVDGININSAPPSGVDWLAGILYGESAGTAENVRILNMNTPISNPSYNSYGIWLDAVSTTVSVTVKDCTIVGYNRNGIMTRGNKLTVDINGNVVTGPGTIGPTTVPNGIVITYGSGGTVRCNTISNNHYYSTAPTYLSFGIMGWYAKDGVITDHNVIYDTDVGIGPSDYSPIYDNQIYNCMWGIELEGGSKNNEITCNLIRNNYYGIHLLGPGSPYYTGPGDEPGPGNTASYNNIFGNTEGVRNWDATQIFKAENNWWGNTSGPYHPTLNPSGTGDNVSDYVNFDHWLLQPFPPALLSPVLYVDPSVVECWTPSYGKNFTIEVKIDDVTDFFSYELKLYWNTTLLDLLSMEITPPWPQYFIGKNETREDLGRYWLGVTAYGVPSFNGSTTIAALTFKITFDPVYPQNMTCILDLADTILAAPFGVPISHMVYDSEYNLYSTKPKIEVQPSTFTAHALNKVFTVDVCAVDVVNLYEFNFTMSYNTTLLDATDVTIGPFLQEPRVIYKTIIDDAQGQIRVWAWSVAPAPPANGTGVLATITFKVTSGIIWYKNMPDPQLTCSFDLYGTLLITNTGFSIEHDVIDGTYVYAPKPGDIDMDGEVNLVDLRIVAYYYDPNYNIIADLNRDGKVNILDLSIVASYYGEDC